MTRFSPEPESAVLASGMQSPSATVWSAVNPVARRLLAMQGALLLASAPLYHVTGISIRWSTAVKPMLLLVLLGGAWLTYVFKMHKPRQAMFAEALLATLLLITLTNIAGPAQYPAVALGFPEPDRWLAAADAALGINVAALTAWTVAHRAVAWMLVASYFSLLPQFVLPLIALGILYRDRTRLWEYIFHFHFCLILTLLGVALMPAACAFSYYGFSSIIDQTRFIDHFTRLRAGTFHDLRLDNVEGMITFPSFHTAGGLFVTWAFRGRRVWFGALVVLNALLIASTMLTGAHYGIDVIATFALFAASILVWRSWGSRGLQEG